MICLRVCVCVTSDLCVAHASCCSQSLLNGLAFARPLLATAGSAPPVSVLQQEVQHVEVTTLGGVHQHTLT